MSISLIRDKMIEYYKGDAKRINHLLKVEAYATIIAEKEKVSSDIFTIISILGYIHDIGIKLAQEKYSSTSGKLQEKLGEEPARNLVLECGFSKAVADRVSYIVAHHHTYENINGLDHQILIESDILVNIFEDDISPTIIPTIKQNIFKTKTGLQLLNTLYN